MSFPPSTKVADPSVRTSLWFVRDRQRTGPLIIGIVLNWWLWGILLMQYLMYLNDSRSKKDRLLLRGIVHFLWLMETIQSILALSDGLEWFVYHFGDYSSLLESYDSPISNPICDSIIAFPVQLVYCWRIWVLSGWILIPSVIAFSALVAASSGIVHGITNQIAGAMTHIQPNPWVPVMLLKFKSKDYLSRSVLFILRRLLLFTLETNILTALMALSTLCFVLIEPIGPYKTMLLVTTGYNIGKVYSNCFMILLNQRSSWLSQETTQRIKIKAPFRGGMLRNWVNHIPKWFSQIRLVPAMIRVQPSGFSRAKDNLKLKTNAWFIACSCTLGIIIYRAIKHLHVCVDNLTFGLLNNAPVSSVDPVIILCLIVQVNSRLNRSVIHTDGV
ncbi:hypothetical protein NP233_g9674 [Leucocoprinus birnbaumii]|uniref:DUF6534 domain-containing protein n=1 Tax=Leucocoprinus birnbaumii TaxID=56174 RepID=A0AAD5YM06_9AGAR|nr:hypothetical protein NP233_g9674 [Leucocoprinus birnbaumii]